MILTYSKDRFVSLIQGGSKIHTFREDPHRRWKPGMSIQHWRGNPRNVRQNPYKFADGECKGIQEAEIHAYNHHYNTEDFGLTVTIDGRQLTQAEIETVANNDGLSVAEFKRWFTPPESPTWKGRCIHFTDFKY